MTAKYKALADRSILELAQRKKAHESDSKAYRAQRRTQWMRRQRYKMDKYTIGQI
jgi:hypothetical protein